MRDRKRAIRTDTADWTRRTVVASCAWPLIGSLGCSGRDDVRAERPSTSSNRRPDARRAARATTDAGRHQRPRPPWDQPQIRVRVASESDPTVELGSVGQRLWLTVPDTGAGGRLVVGPVQCRAKDGRWSIRSNRNGRTLAFETPVSDRIRLVTMDSADPRVAYRSIGLPGVVNLVAQSDGKVDVICHLDMETYLPGVLAGELYESWLPATHEAVAIAARSFAVCERQFWLAKRDFDVVAGEKSQMWVGATTSSRPHEAVRRTRGKLLIFEGAVVPGYYSAACGGRPARAVEAISPNPVNAIRPLEGEPVTTERCGCRTFGSHGSWTVALPGPIVANAVRAWAGRRALSSLSGLAWPLDLQVTERRSSGRPTTFRIRGRSPGDTAEISAAELQRVLNATQKGRPVRSSDFEVVRRRGELLVSGAGFGHGVGLCQYGSEAMARDGASSVAILQRYYPGAAIRTSWS